MVEPAPKNPAERFSRLFRKAGVFLAKGRMQEALAVFRDGEALARAIGDEERRKLFLEEIAQCEKQLSNLER